MNSKHPIILASQSPRRQELMKDAGIPFTIQLKEVEEIVPTHIKSTDAAKYLAELKASAYDEEVEAGNIVITADTVVELDGELLGKPKDHDEANKMLHSLSGRSHLVITGVCIRSLEKTIAFDSVTTVYFKGLSDADIEYYIENYKPYDKAGAYGIQEWIGLMGVSKIEGSYFNVVGLPIAQLYEELKTF